MSSPFQNEAFSAPDSRVKNVSDIILRAMAAEQPKHILDVGCGTGETLRYLVESMPGATGLGVDISHPNIAVAKTATESSPKKEQLRFIQGDFWALPSGQYDLIVSDSVFHLIPLPTVQIFAKVAENLSPGGVLVMTIPYACPYNTLLWMARRVLRAIKCKFTDQMILSIAKMLHGGKYSDSSLRERIIYMYHVPQAYLSPELHRLLTCDLGLELFFVELLPHASLGQAKHKIVGYRKSAGK